MMHAHPFHRARLDRKLTIEQLAEATRLPVIVVTRIDEGRFGELAAGIYARSQIRAVACALGLDPAGALAAVEPLLPEAPDPLVAFREAVRPRTGPSWPSWAAAGWEGLKNEMRTGLWTAPARTTEATRAKCAALDALILCAINAFALALAAALCGQSPHRLAAAAPGAVSLLFLLTTAHYFVLMAGIAGRTLGERACAVSARSSDSPLKPRDIIARAAAAWCDESSVLVNLVFASCRSWGTRGAPPKQQDLSPAPM